MGPNSRPPLTSRIRASFEGKRSHSSDVTSPTGPHGFITQDSEALRLAIDEAINSSTFQNAIAANLANLIKPSIRDALDTLQPVVEAVYSHDLLLRKTNRSVEDILIRLDTNAEDRQASRRASSEHKDWEDDRPHPLQAHPIQSTENVKSTENEPTPTNGKLEPTPQQATSSPPPDFEQFKQLLDESNAHIATTLSELMSSLNASNGRLAGVVEGVDSLKAFSEQSNTTTSVMQAQLDQLKADIGEVMDAIGSDLGKNVKSVHEKVAAQDTSLLSSHTTKLDAIATDLGALKGHSDTIEKIEAISTELGALKGAIEASTTANSEGFTSLSEQVGTVLTTIEGHTSTLGEISEKGPHPDIIAALQQSNDHHAAHAVALGEIKERSLATPPTPAPTPTVEGTPDSTAALQELKADLASLKENIEAGLSSNNENVTGLGSKIDTVLTTIEGHKASDQSAEILAAVQQSNESHAAHATALEGIKSLNVAPEGGNAVLEPQIGAIIATLESHTAALDEIKATGGSHTSALEAHTAALDEIKTSSTSHATALEGIKSIGGEPAPVPEAAALEPQIGAIIATLEAHTAALDAIKAAHGSHAEALEGIKSLSAAPAPVAEGGNTAALEPQIGAIIATLEAHSAALDEIKATGGYHATALEGIKSISAPAAESTSTLVPQIGAIIATLESHTAALDEIKGTTTSHSTALEQSRSVDAAPPAPILDKLQLPKDHSVRSSKHSTHTPLSSMKSKMTCPLKFLQLSTI
jgi:hypothetical protein